jgi:hypothetical protein
MIRRSTNANGLTASAPSVAAKYAGWTMLFASGLLILGGAYRTQDNMLRSGLLFLFLTLTLVPGAIRESWLGRSVAVGLAIVGVAFALST